MVCGACPHLEVHGEEEDARVPNRQNIKTLRRSDTAKGVRHRIVARLARIRFATQLRSPATFTGARGFRSRIGFLNLALTTATEEAFIRRILLDIGSIAVFGCVGNARLPDHHASRRGCHPPDVPPCAQLRGKGRCVDAILLGG
jgi:hypothetical protein